MACGCSKGGKRTVSIRDSSAPPDGMSDTEMSMVLMEYTGNEPSKARLRSRMKPAERYAYSKDEPQFLVYKGDVNWLESLGHFSVVSGGVSESAPLVNELPALESNIVAPDFSNIPADVLSIDPVIVANLKKHGYETIGSLKLASDGELLALKGMGSKRLKDLRKALDAI